MTAWHESVTCLPDKPPLVADEIGYSPQIPSSSSGQAGGGDSCSCFSAIPGSAINTLIYHCSSSPSFSQKQARSSSASSPHEFSRFSCSVRSKVHVNENEYVFCCSGWCSNDLTAFSLNYRCIKKAWLNGRAWLSLACSLFRSARASTCARLASVASRWCCNSTLFRMLAFEIRLRVNPFTTGTRFWGQNYLDLV